MDTSDIVYRDACADDADHVLEYLEPFVVAQQILPRSSREMAVLVENAFLAHRESQIVGFAAIEIYSLKLAEIQCLAVSAEVRGLGIGRELVNRCVTVAREKGILEVMVISSSDDFLTQCGFDYTLPNQKRALFYRPGDNS